MMAKKHLKKALSLILTLVMVSGMLQIGASAADLICTKTEHTHSDACYETSIHTHGDDCYKIHEHNLRLCDGAWHEHSTETCPYETHTHGDNCYQVHTHSFFCLLGCNKEGELELRCNYDEGEIIYNCDKDRTFEFSCTTEKDLICRLEEGKEYRNLVCELNEHTHGKNCYKEADTALHLDIHIALTATYTLDGVPYTADVSLTADDYTSGRLQITATAPFFITGTEIYDAGQRRFNGTFPVGTSSSPVYYTICLTKDVDFNVNGETVSIPMTFERTVHFWHPDNICETIMGSSSRKARWANGEFVYGGMDFQLGSSTASGTTDPGDPEPTKATLTIQKNVAGVTLTVPTTYTFDVYNSIEKVDTVELTVAAAGTTAIGALSLPLNESYYVVEENAPAIEGYTLTITADNKTGATSDTFTLTGDTAVVFTNTYTEIPPAPPEQVTETWTVWHEYYSDGEYAGGQPGEETFEVNEGEQPSDADIAGIARLTEYEGMSYTYTSYSLETNDRAVILRYDYTTPEPDPEPDPEPVTEIWTVWHEYYSDGEYAGGQPGDETFEVNESEQPSDADIAGIARLTEYEGKAYTYTSYSLETLDKVVILRYDYTTPEPPAPPTPPTPPTPPITLTYTLTVNWVDEDGTALADQLTRTITAFTSYTTEQKSFDGYTFVQTSGDAVSGVMNSNKAVTYIYSLDEVIPPADIPDEDPPLADLPDEDPPLADLPDEEVPLADVPETGDPVILYTALAAVSGLVWIGLKKKKED